MLWLIAIDLTGGPARGPDDVKKDLEHSATKMAESLRGRGYGVTIQDCTPACEAEQEPETAGEMADPCL